MSGFRVMQLEEDDIIEAEERRRIDQEEEDRWVKIRLRLAKEGQYVKGNLNGIETELRMLEARGTYRPIISPFEFSVQLAQDQRRPSMSGYSAMQLEEHDEEERQREAQEAEDRWVQYKIRLEGEEDLGLDNRPKVR